MASLGRSRSTAARLILGLCLWMISLQLSLFGFDTNGARSRNILLVGAFAFTVAPSIPTRSWRSTHLSPSSYTRSTFSDTKLSAQIDDDMTTDLTTSTAWFLGIGGTFAALVTFYSEYTLKTTGCGIPAGPFGLFGLIEGLSYLGVTGIAAYSIVTKVKTGKGLPAGPLGLVGAAEGLSFLAIAAGLVVLVLQVTDYGYIPNAVPMEGGMCS